MLNVIVDYLRQKMNLLTYVSQSYGLAEIVDRRDGEENVSFPSVYVNGELSQVSFDSHPSLAFFILDGEIERTTSEGELYSCADQVTEVYKLKLYFFNSGKEISDCASFMQRSAYNISKWLTSDNSQLQEELNLQEARISATSFNFAKKSVWDELHNGITYSLSERQQLCRIDFDVFISGVESCFEEPCDGADTIFNFCQLQDSMYDIITNESQTFLLNGTNQSFGASAYVDLRNKTITEIFYDGVYLSPAYSPPPYTWNRTTGLLTFNISISSGIAIHIKYNT